MKKKQPIEPILLAVALGLLALAAAGMAFYFPSEQDITGVSSSPPHANNPPKVTADDLATNLAAWTSPPNWKEPENGHRLFISDGYLFYASEYPDGKFIVKSDAAARSPSGVLISWYQKYNLDFTNPNVDHEDPDGDGFSNIVEYKNGAAKASDVDGSSSTNPRDADAHPSYFSRLRLKQYESRPFHIEFRGYSQIGGTTQFQIYLHDLPPYAQPHFLKTGDPVGSEGYVVGKFEQKMVEEEDPNTHIKSTVDESTLELIKPDIDFHITLTYRKEIDSPESTADFVMLMPADRDAVTKVPRGQTFSINEIPKSSYQMISIDDNGNSATIRDMATKQLLHVPKLDPAEWDEVPVETQNATGSPKAP